jgi:hypothetical protein
MYSSIDEVGGDCSEEGASYGVVSAKVSDVGAACSVVDGEGACSIFENGAGCSVVASWVDVVEDVVSIVDCWADEELVVTILDEVVGCAVVVPCDELDTEVLDIALVEDVVGSEDDWTDVLVVEAVLDARDEVLAGERVVLSWVGSVSKLAVVVCWERASFRVDTDEMVGAVSDEVVWDIGPSGGDMKEEEDEDEELGTGDEDVTSVAVCWSVVAWDEALEASAVPLAAFPASLSSLTPFVAALVLPIEEVEISTPVVEAVVFVAAAVADVLLAETSDWVDVGFAKVSRSTVDALVSLAWAETTAVVSELALYDDGA